MNSSPFVINDKASGEQLFPIDYHTRIYDEAWLQELLRQHPEILPVAEIEPMVSDLIPIGREVITDTGIIDNLFISPTGYLVLIETKLWRNPEAKRDVVVQAIDYGSSIAKWRYEKLEDIVKAYTRKYENSEMNLAEWVGNNHSLPDDRRYFEDTVTKNLRLGRFVTLIVGDKIRQSVIEMLNYVNKYPHLAPTVALIELQCYQLKQNESWPLLVVPSIVARTEIVERSVIQVTVTQAGEYTVEVQQEKPVEPDRRRIRLSEEAYWELLKELEPNGYQQVEKLIAHYREKDGVTVEAVETSIGVKLILQDTGQHVSIFHVSKIGKIYTWVEDAIRQLNEAGLDGKALTASYKTQVRSVLHLIRPYGGMNIMKVDVNAFMQVVDKFIDDVQHASEKE
jgi:hypothetical protein